MSIEIDVVLPGRLEVRPTSESPITITRSVERYHLSIVRQNLEGGLGSYRAALVPTVAYRVPGYKEEEVVFFPHPYSEGWEKCVSRALSALADARRA